MSIPFTRITASHVEWQTWSWKHTPPHHLPTHTHLGSRSKHTRFSVAFCEVTHFSKLTNIHLGPNLPLVSPPQPCLQGRKRCRSCDPDNIPHPSFPGSLLSSHPGPAPDTSPPNLCSGFTSHRELNTKKVVLVHPGPGDPIQLSSLNQRKTSLAWHRSASPPQNLLSHAHKKRSVLRDNLPLSRAGWCQLSDYKLLIYASTAAKSSK